MWKWIKQVATAAGTESPLTSMGVIAGGVAAASLVVSMIYGAGVVSEAEQATVIDQAKAAWNAGVAFYAKATALGATLVALWGRLRAAKTIFGMLLGR